MAFKPGQSGNPSGRPKVDFEVRQLAREYGQEAIEKLVAIMRGDNPALGSRRLVRRCCIGATASRFSR